MRLRILSDLHLEHQNPLPDLWDREDYDVIIAAGDLHGSCAQAVEILAPFGPSVFVPGNHEHFGHILQDNLQTGRALATKTQVSFLARDIVVIDGVRFIGATLWTDYALYRTTKHSMVIAGQSLDDHRVIKYREASGHIARFMPWHTRAEHLADLMFLAQTLAEPFDGHTVVVTHHLPSNRSIAPRFASSVLNPTFASDLDHIIEQFQPALWVHGHTHNVSDYQIGKTRIVCNPRGYGAQNAVFDPRLTIEI